MSAPQPARFRARSSAVGAATRARTHAVGAAVDVTVAAEVVAQDRHVPVLDEHRRPRLDPLRLHHVDDLVPRGGEREIVGPLKGRLDRHGVLDPVDPEGALPPFGTGDQVPDVVLVDQAPRVDEPLAARAPLVYSSRTRRRSMTAAWSRSRSAGRRRSARPTARGRSQGDAGRGLGLGPEGGGQRLYELAQRRLRVVGHRHRPDQKEQGLRLRRRQAAEVGARTAQE
jgi:hypothetical protein